MPNTFITPETIASRALATLYNTIVLAALVHRDYDDDFNGKVGDTVNVRTPATFTVDEYDRTDGINIQNITEGTFPVELDTILDVSVAVTSEELTLDLKDFDTQVLQPACEALAQDVDGRLAEQLVDAAEGGGGGGTATWRGSVPSTVFTGELGARAKLGRAKMPLSNRSAVFGPEAAGVCLEDSKFVEADKSGTTTALREGELGRVYGFNTYESQTFGYGAGDKGQADGVAFHRDAITLVSRTLEKPMGVADSLASSKGFKGLGLRVVRDYDIDQKQDVISLDFLCGIQTLRAAGAVQLSLGLGS